MFKQGILELEENNNYEKGKSLITAAALANIPGAFLYMIRRFRQCDYILDENQLLSKCWWNGGDMSWIECELYRIYNDFVYLVSTEKSRRESIHYEWDNDDPRDYIVRGIIYLTGRSLLWDNSRYMQDYDKAVEYFSIAANFKNKDGLYWLGFCYEFGYGVTIDINCAVQYYKQSATMGMHESAYRLAYCLLNYGIDVEKSRDCAIKLLQKIVDNYNPPKDNKYVNIYGDIFTGSREDWMGSTAWRALSLIGDLYFNGISVEKNIDIALKKWEQASSLGSSEASYKLGEYYSTINNVEKAEYYYRYALNQGFFDAYKNFKEFI